MQQKDRYQQNFNLFKSAFDKIIYIFHHNKGIGQVKLIKILAGFLLKPF